MNSVEIVGRLARDPDIYMNGDSVTAKFTVAVNRRFKNKDGRYDADFPSCIAFGRTAELVEKYFKKGSAIGICGRIQTGSYTNRDGQKVYTTDVVADSVEFVESRAASGQQTSGTGSVAPPPMPSQTPPQAPVQAPPQYQQQAPTQAPPQAQPQMSVQEFMQLPPGSEEELPFI